VCGARLRDPPECDDGVVLPRVRGRGEDRLVLAPEDLGHLGGKPAQHGAGGVDHVPAALDVVRLWRKGLHRIFPTVTKSRPVPGRQGSLPGHSWDRQSLPIIDSSLQRIILNEEGERPSWIGPSRNNSLSPALSPTSRRCSMPLRTRCWGWTRRASSCWPKFSSTRFAV